MGGRGPAKKGAADMLRKLSKPSHCFSFEMENLIVGQYLTKNTQHLNRKMIENRRKVVERRVKESDASGH